MTSYFKLVSRPLVLSAILVVLALPAAAQEIAGVTHGDAVYAHLFDVDGEAPIAPSHLTAASMQNPQQKPPEPHHTGFQALVRSTAADFNAFPRRQSTWVILGIGGLAAGLAHPADDNLNVHLQGSGAGKAFKLGKYLGYGWVQAGAAAGTYLIGRAQGKKPNGEPNKLAHIGFDLVRANLLTQTMTYGVKKTFRRDRPTGECCSFPSGHASVTFAAASVLERHFGYRNAWPTFLIASYVAASRLHEDKHFASDVIFGSALGMTCGWTVVGRHGRDQFALLPVKTRGGVMIALTKN
jgi:membrane-associated phospholipid phosphatase